MSEINTVPDGYTSVTPWIIVDGVDEFIGFITTVFGAEELGRVYDDTGRIGHAEARIDDAIIMMFDSRDGWPETKQFLRVYVDDASAVIERASGNGARIVTSPTPLAFGDQVGRFVDQWGNTWWVQERLEELDWDQISTRMGEPQYVEAMQYLQETLHAEMSNRGRKG